MASEQQSALIKRILFFLLLVVIGLAVWFYPRSKGEDLEKKAKKKITSGAEEVPIRESLRQGNPVTIIHFHLPGDPASEQLADIFNAIQKKYGRLVTVNRAGFQVQPEDWRVQKKIKLPYVMMIVGKENAFHFQGSWNYASAEKKVEELIFGVRRVDKDWRPTVPGMTPKIR
jgi:hypothetical protein